MRSGTDGSGWAAMVDAVHVQAAAAESAAPVFLMRLALA